MSTVASALPHHAEVILATCLADFTCVDRLDLLTEADIEQPAYAAVFAAFRKMRAEETPLISLQQVAEIAHVDVRDIHPLALVSADFDSLDFRVQELRERTAARKAKAFITDLGRLTSTTAGLDTDRALTLTHQLADVLEYTSQSQNAHGKTDFTIDDLLAFDPNRDQNCLLGKRYICKTGSLVIVSQSGIGKSVIAMQGGVCWSLGWALFGIKPVRPLKILIVQAENDEGDAAECFQGIAAHYGITCNTAALETLRRNLRIRRFPSESGASFISRLKRELRDFPADIIIADPLFSFLGADVCDQRALSEFLRGQVNDFLFKTGAAIIFVHHTGKPPPKDASKGKSDVDKSYAGIGSSELTNWARAVIVLEKEKQEGHVYRMTLAKRGTRAGVVDEHGHVQTRIFIEHAREGICWVPSSYLPQGKSEGSKFAEKYPIADMRRHYEPNLDWSDNVDRICKALGCDPKTVNRKRRELEN